MVDIGAKSHYKGPNVAMWAYFGQSILLPYYWKVPKNYKISLIKLFVSLPTLSGGNQSLGSAGGCCVLICRVLAVSIHFFSLDQ